MRRKTGEQNTQNATFLFFFFATEVCACVYVYSRIDEPRTVNEYGKKNEKKKTCEKGKVRLN